jgi:hypothetical protein
VRSLKVELWSDRDYNEKIIREKEKHTKLNPTLLQILFEIQKHL